jgi:hypothetical protein
MIVAVCLYTTHMRLERLAFPRSRVTLYVVIMPQVMLDRVRAPTHRQPGLEVHFQAQLGPDADAGHAIAVQLRVRIEGSIDSIRPGSALRPCKLDSLQNGAWKSVSGWKLYITPTQTSLVQLCSQFVCKWLLVLQAGN